MAQAKIALATSFKGRPVKRVKRAATSEYLILKDLSKQASDGKHISTKGMSEEEFKKLLVSFSK